ncbi:MAG TPA: O-antigen ligase family protein [Polyangiaceae bacterium]|nr:O-antigen ligase family protein [Polyangiaceae bacterium]
MFALPGIVGLLLFIFVRPHEFVDAFRGLPMLYLFFALAVWGMVVDLRVGLAKPVRTPQLNYILLFLTWCAFTMVVRSPATLASELPNLLILLVIFLAIGHGIQSLRAFQLVCGFLLAFTLFVAFISAHQGLGEFECVQVDAYTHGSDMAGKPDGRPCQSADTCALDAPEPEAGYRCEKVGLFGTTSIGHGRVRYLGVLQDPNEMSLAVCVGLPLAIGFLSRKRSATRTAVFVVALLLVAMSTVFSQSRGGQIVFLATLGAYFVRRFGWKGMIAAAIMAAPIMLLGGRSGAEASASSEERLEAWGTAVTLFKQFPLIGVGCRQFLEYHFITAHNSYLLAPAELGFPGFVIWSSIVYISAKTPIMALKRYANEPGAGVVRTWAMALTASYIGLCFGIFFLSFCYHFVLWVYFGMSGALFSAIKRHDPGFQVRFGGRDLAFVATACALILLAVGLYTRMKGAS